MRLMEFDMERMSLHTQLVLQGLMRARAERKSLAEARQLAATEVFISPQGEEMKVPALSAPLAQAAMVGCPGGVIMRRSDQMELRLEGVE